MSPFNGQPSRAQQVFLALTPKLTGCVSLVGSSYIIYDVLRRFPARQRHTYHRLLLGLSVFDILMTTGLVTSTWGMPADTQNVAFAVGNVRTCEAVGFLETAGTTAVLYNGSLSVYYLLRIKCGWKATQLAKVEPYLHAVPILFGCSTMMASLVLGLYNAGLWDCWIYPHPHGCLESWRNDGVSDCERGDNATLYQWLFDVIPKWVTVLFVTLNMVWIHRVLLEKERASQRYAARQTQASRQLARQSYLYVGALYITYIPVIVTRLTEVLTGGVYYGMIVTISITIPLQGFWNLMVYLRPRYLQTLNRRRKPTSTPSDSASGLGLRLHAMSRALLEGALEDEGDDEVGESTALSSKAEPAAQKHSCGATRHPEMFGSEHHNAASLDNVAEQPHDRPDESG